MPLDVRSECETTSPSTHPPKNSGGVAAQNARIQPPESLGNAAQMRWSAGEWIFRQMQMKIPKVYWR